MSISERVLRAEAAKQRVQKFGEKYVFHGGLDPDMCNFAIGNPTEMPMPALVDTLQNALVPQSPDWFAYKWSEAPARKIAAETLSARQGIDYHPDDIAMTTGGFGALASAIYLLTEPGDEVLFNLPPWFNYEAMILTLGAEPVKVPVRRSDFDLDIDAIEAAIGPRTRIVIVNSPNNPTGKIYPPETLTRLADVLTRKSVENGRTIYLLSDEAYARLVFAGNAFHPPAAFYPETMVAYSYGKTLLAPGQRLGYLAMAPTVTNRERYRGLLRVVQSSLGYLFPNAMMQHAIGDLEKLCIDMDAMQDKRDVMINGLRAAGYDVHTPEGTFYLLPRCPVEDDEAFADHLFQNGVLVLPGTVCEFPGHLRISLTASLDMVERSLPRFAKTLEEALA